eukprot:5337945-Amphidinium_carterae.1
MSCFVRPQFPSMVSALGGTTSAELDDIIPRGAVEWLEPNIAPQVPTYSSKTCSPSGNWRRAEPPKTYFLQRECKQIQPPSS